MQRIFTYYNFCIVYEFGWWFRKKKHMLLTIIEQQMGKCSVDATVLMMNAIRFMCTNSCISINTLDSHESNWTELGFFFSLCRNFKCHFCHFTTDAAFHFSLRLHWTALVCILYIHIPFCCCRSSCGCCCCCCCIFRIIIFELICFFFIFSFHLSFNREHCFEHLFISWLQ